ncbi:signal peptidase I [Pseudomonas oryziphila]|uniref:Signal peptidase I n=1 Tax=Pseudomonas oryziphila TaxID=2894079 RepID=A0ABM7CVP8_9PSED|nr:signal peptidase I [Pseudomonas oryziphila]AZL75594.1 signal peptidase I [Pseudomonas oryziphila]
MQSRQSASSAFVISLLIAGSGLYYVGRLRWALILLALFFIDFFLIGLFATPKAVIVGLWLALALKLGSACLAAWIAWRGHPGSEPPGARLVAYAAAVVVLAAVLVVLRGPLFGYRLDQIPSGSMEPALQIGDHIVSDSRLLGDLKVGDVVLYRQGNVEGFKRVAGVAGDRLEIVAGELLVNGRNLGLFHAPAEMVRSPYSLSLAPLVVEPGHVYLLGDRRDNSTYSRYFGQVAVADVTAKVNGVWYAKNRQRIGTTFE